VQDVTPAEGGDDDWDDGRRSWHGHKHRSKVGPLWAVTSGEDPTTSSNQSLYRIEHGHASLVADLFEFEKTVNPHPEAVDSNPYDVESLGKKALVIDAGGNSLLEVSKSGKVKLVAVFPDELVSTANAEKILGEDFPPMLPAQPVPTSVAIGPDGAYYVSELKGFPAPLGESRIWRVDPNARNAECGESRKCKVVFDGLTSIVDLRFGPRGKLYAVELEATSWLAVELAIFEGAPIPLEGGSVKACSLKRGTCSEIVSGQPVLTSITFRKGRHGHERLWGAINSLTPGQADVVELDP
jgi:hypothetical protein